MNLRRLSLLLISSVAISGSLLSAADLGAYRKFHLGMSLADVKKQANLNASEAKLISSRPQRIEELDWHVTWTPVSAARADPFSNLLFRFYNGELFEIVVTYDRDQTRGFTEADMVDAISGVYGPVTKTVPAEASPNSGAIGSVMKATALWEDAQNRVTLVHLAYGTGFGMLISSRANKAMAEQAIVESERLDRAEAPQREVALRARQLADSQAADEKSRAANKPGFRP